MPQARCTHSLPNRPESVSKARTLMRTILTAHDHQDALDPALLIMSELVTNAAIHGTQSDTVKLLCELDDDILTMGVIDYDERQPVILHAGVDDERGRGLMLVDSISDEWGCRPHDGGKLVFASLKLARRFGDRCASGPVQVGEDCLEDLGRGRAEGRGGYQAVGADR